MPKLPKLKVNRIPFGYSDEETYDFEQAQNFPYGQGTFVVVGGQEIHSYVELVQLASRDDYKDKEFLEVILIPFTEIVSGG